jgi:trk system potassium uptake protein TrkA
VRVVIIGAGDVGEEMARILCVQGNDVVVVDLDATLLERLHDSLDLMTVCGDGSKVRVQQRAQIEEADLLLAVTSMSAVNILACVVAKRFGVKRTIARVRSGDHFDEGDGLTAEALGVDVTIITELECASDIADVMIRPQVKETALLSHADAQIVNFQILGNSPMLGSTLANFVKPELLEEVRICAILRHGHLVMPRGETGFMPFDEIYVAGHDSAIEELIDWATPDTPLISKVIIAGATPLAHILTQQLKVMDMSVTIIEPDETRARQAAEQLGQAMVLRGEATDIDVLREAGIENCDAFLALQSQNEEIIISCMLAKRHGARKVIATTNNLDYLRIITGIQTIDCGFSPLVSAINRVIKYIATESRETAAVLKRVPVVVVEFVIAKKAAIAGQRIQSVKLPCEMVFAIIIRDDQLVPAVGSETLKAGDRVCVMVRGEHVDAAAKLFGRKAK